LTGVATAANRMHDHANTLILSRFHGMIQSHYKRMDNNVSAWSCSRIRFRPFAHPQTMSSHFDRRFRDATFQRLSITYPILLLPSWPDKVMTSKQGRQDSGLDLFRNSLSVNSPPENYITSL
jgi:hypothetical protein